MSWKLTKRNAACSTCERPFEEEEPFFSLLAFEADDVTREDVCRACFPKRQETAGERLIFWRSRHRSTKKAVTVDFEALEGLFLALEGREEVELRELRYLLALLLMRKKRVKLLRTARKPDGEAMILRRPRRTDELCVYVFDLTPERAEVLRTKLRAIFEGADLGELLSAPDGVEPAAQGSEGESEAEAEARSEGAEEAEPTPEGEVGDDDAPRASSAAPADAPPAAG